MNYEILRWARERAGYSLEDIAASLGKTPEEIQGWESGATAPTYVQLEKLAYQLYKRPLALFFFPAPPEEPTPKKSFRTLPDSELAQMSPDTRFAIRQARVMQLNLYEMTHGENPAKSLLFREMRGYGDRSARYIAQELRKYLNISLADQVSWKDPSQALEIWRDAVQNKGIFVFKRSFKQEDISGFCLTDDQFPVIYLNNSTPFTRQIFTLIHEVSHIFAHTNGVTKLDDRYIDTLTGDAKAVEVFSNLLTAEFLVPNEDFDRCVPKNPQDEEAISTLANRYKVSREVVLRKLLDRELIDRQFYENKTKQWNDQYKLNRKKQKEEREGGGNWYATQTAYFGKRFLELAFSSYYQQRYSTDQLADYLGLRAKNISGLEQFFLGKLSR